MKNELGHVRNDLYDKKALLQDKTNKLQENEKNLKELEKSAEAKRRAHKGIVDEKEATINSLKKIIAKGNDISSVNNQVCYSRCSIFGNPSLLLFPPPPALQIPPPLVRLHFFLR